MQTKSTIPVATIYAVITYAVFGSIQTTVAFYSKEDAEKNVIEWANDNSYPGAAFKSADEAIDWFIDADENVEVSIRIEETLLYGDETTEFKDTIVFGGNPECINTFTFGTQAELNAFYKGMEAMDGWNDYRSVENLNEDDLKYIKENHPEMYDEVQALLGTNTQDNLLCGECGFNMGKNYENCGTAEDGVCPECGVSDSATAVFVESLQGETATIEVVECTCGYHMGIDSSFLDQVSDMKVSCPSCGATINTALIPEISHDDCDDNLNAIYEKFNHMASNWFQSAKVGDVVYNKIDLDFSLDEVLELIKEDDYSVVVSLYSEDNDSVKDLYFDAFELARAEFSEDKIVMKAESGEKFTIEFSGLNKTKTIAVNSSSNKELYLVTIDHVEGPCTQLCDTEANAKAFVFGHITSYDTFEEFDAALKGSIDAIEGLINYTIEKHGCAKMRIEPAVEMRPRYSIVMSVNNKESGTFEDYVNEETAIEAFESIRKNGYHIPEGEFGDLNEKITFEQYGRVEFSMDVELWDNYNNHHGFGIIEHTRIVMINGVVQNG